jgi:hypothetical protein
MECVENLRRLKDVPGGNGGVQDMVASLHQDEKGRLDYLELAHAMKEKELKVARNIKDQAVAREAAVQVRQRYRMVTDALYEADADRSGCLTAEVVGTVLNSLATVQVGDVLEP